MALFSLLSLSLWRIKSAPLITIKCLLKKQSALEGTWLWAHYIIYPTQMLFWGPSISQSTHQSFLFLNWGDVTVFHTVLFLSLVLCFFGEKKIWGFKKNNKNLLLLEKGMYVTMTPLKSHQVIKPFIRAAGQTH